MSEKNGKVVYDWKRRVQITLGESGQETTSGEATHGEYPSCLPEDWKHGPANSSNLVNFTERKCSCGKHFLYWVKIPQEFWPNDYEERVRVIEKD